MIEGVVVGVVYKVFLLLVCAKVGKTHWERLRRAPKPFHALKDKGFKYKLGGKIFKKNEHPKGAIATRFQTFPRFFVWWGYRRG